MSATIVQSRRRGWEVIGRCSRWSGDVLRSVVEMVGWRCASADRMSLTAAAGYTRRGGQGGVAGW